MNNLTGIKVFLAGIIGSITYTLGGWDMLIQILVTLMVVDYITGILIAIIEKKLNSSIGFKGLFKKFAILIIIMVAVQVDMAIGNPANYFRNIVCLLYIANEAISILENCGKLGVPLPTFLMNILEQIKEKADQGQMETTITKEEVD